MAVVGWVDTADLWVSDVWSDAVTISDVDPDTLAYWLQVAYEQCVEYAPAVLPNPLPQRYALAQVLQAKNLFDNASGKQDVPDDLSGVVPMRFPMDWQVKNLLRPKRGIGHVG